MFSFALVKRPVNWSVTPQVGTVSASGLYTAPASVNTQQVATVQASSAADPSRTASVFVTLNPPSAIAGPQAYGSAFLPAVYQGTAIGGESTSLTQAQIRHIRNPETPLDLQQRQ